MFAASCRELQAGSLRSPKCSSIALTSRRDSSAEIKNGHPHRQAVGHLVEDYALQSVGYVTVDFDPAIDRAGVHDQAIRFQQTGALLG